MSKVIAITGVSRGLGRALVNEFHARGHKLIGCARSREAIDDLRKLFPDALFEAVDVTDQDTVRAWSKKGMQKFGVPGLLINNAAIINRGARLWEVPSADFDAVIDVNIKGVANVLRAFLPGMVAAKKGVIVNLSSGWGRSTDAEVAPYCASKYAIEGLTLALAQELPRGMSAIPLNPGVINTDMLRTCFGESAEHYATPEKWAKRAAEYILDLGPAHNGRSLTVG